MTTLSTVDRTKLVKLLGLLGSEHAGERDAAGLAAHRFVVSRGLTWTQVLDSDPAPDTAVDAYARGFHEGMAAYKTYGPLDAQAQKRSRDRARADGYAQGFADAVNQQMAVRQKEAAAAFERGVDMGQRLRKRAERRTSAGGAA